MKRALLTALALLVALPALAFNPVGSATPRVVPAKSLPLRAIKPLAQRVLVLYDSYDDALNQSNVKAEAAITAKNIGPTFSSWEEMGAQVDFLRSDFFEGYADSISGSASTQRPCALWQKLGSYYPTVVCVGFSADTSIGKVARKRYFCADSTTAKIIHIGGWNGASGWNGWTFGVSDTGGSNAYFDQRKACVQSYTNSYNDTLWFGQGGYGVRTGLVTPGVSAVVRLFSPIALSTYFGWGSDSTTSVLPAAGDSVAKPGEIMPVAWRVYWSGKASVDFIKCAGTADYDFSMGHVLTALVSRTTKLAPMLAAMEWDDVFDANPTSATRPSNAAYDSVVSEFRTTWGIPIVPATNPRHAAEYYAGSNPTRESAWASGAGWTWMRKQRTPWVHHAHDSTSSDIASGLVGRFGGYSSQNGSGLIPWTSSGGDASDSVFTYGFSRFFYTHRNAASGADKYTLVYRLQWADSVRRSICPECATPPYLSFPNNEMLPTDWRARPASVASANAAGYWSRWKSYQGNGTCTIDSTLWAFHYGLGLPSGAELFLRASNVSNNGTGAAFNYKGHMATGYALAGDDAPKNWTVSGDNDSVVAKTCFSYPDERRSDWINGRLVKVRSIGTTPYDQGARSAYTANVQRILPGLMGSRTGTLTSAGFSTWCDSWSADPGGVINGNSTDQKNFGTAHVRIVYFHPNGSWSNATGPNGNYAIAVARLGLLGGKRVLESVAGHSLIRWVYPWEVYNR